MRRLLALCLAAVAGCSAPPLVTPETPAPTDPCLVNLCIHDEPRNKADMLFVLDDGPGMSPMLDTWRASLPGMLDRLAGFAADGGPSSYHFGAITADLGAGGVVDQPSGCRAGGDGAKLRASADMTGGVRFVDWNQVSGTQNVPDVAAALDAISNVGSAGCMVRQPLEAAYRALHDSAAIPENAGFLRPDAFLVVVFVSNADDCSVPPASDLFDGSSAGVAAYGPLTPFRCTQFGIACNGAPVPPTRISDLTLCEPQRTADGGKLLDIDRYVDFFSKPAAQGGVKLDPTDVILAAIAGPSVPIGVTVTTPCAEDTTAASCPKLYPSCVAPNDLTRYGDPAVRLRAVVASARDTASDSICNTDDGSIWSSILGPPELRPIPCLRDPVPTRSDGTPDCTVESVVTLPDGSQSTTELSSCAADGDVAPCWRLVDRLAQYDAGGCTPPGTAPPPTCTLPSSCQPLVDPAGARELYTVTIDWGPDGGPSVPTTSIIRCASS